jgi:hypothetical protein
MADDEDTGEVEFEWEEEEEDEDEAYPPILVDVRVQTLADAQALADSARKGERGAVSKVKITKQAPGTYAKQAKISDKRNAYRGAAWTKPSRAEVTRQLAWSRGWRPADGKSSKVWRSAARTVQRQMTTAGEKRGTAKPNVEFLKAVRRAKPESSTESRHYKEHYKVTLEFRAKNE